MTVDHYAVLGLQRNASADDIQRAYRTLALRYHPDRNSAPDAASRMVAVNKAYEVLGEPRLRREYDRQLARASQENPMSELILQAARDVVLRSGWRVVEDTDRTMVLEKDRSRVRIVFADTLDNVVISRITHGLGDVTVVLAASVDGPIAAASSGGDRLVMAIDLMQGRCYGSRLPETDPRRSLLAPFL